jgi:hypothetical protein
MRAQPFLEKINDAGAADRRFDGKIGCRTDLHEEQAGSAVVLTYWVSDGPSPVR